MNEDIRIYKPDKRFNLVNGLVILVFPLLLTVPHLVSGMMESHQLRGLAGFWTMAMMLALAPAGFTLEVGKDYVKTYFIGFSVAEVHSANVQKVAYGNLFSAGLGFGKGLRYRTLINGRSKAYKPRREFLGQGGMFSR